MAMNVTTYESAQQLSDAIGLVVHAELDDQQLENLYQPGYTVIAGGAYHTLIEGAMPEGSTVLAKGLYYTVVEITV